MQSFYSEYNLWLRSFKWVTLYQTIPFEILQLSRTDIWMGYLCMSKIMRRHLWIQQTCTHNLIPNGKGVWSELNKIVLAFCLQLTSLTTLFALRTDILTDSILNPNAFLITIGISLRSIWLLSSKNVIYLGACSMSYFPLHDAWPATKCRTCTWTQPTEAKP